MAMLKLYAVVFTCALLTACADSAPDPVASQATAEASTGTRDLPVSQEAVNAFPDGAHLAEIAVDTSSREPTFLVAGQSVSSEIVAPVTGAIDAVGVEVGNFEGTSEGTIHVEICQGGSCSDGNAQLAGSADNSYVAVALERPLTVRVDSPIAVTVSRASGDNPFAVWTYPAAATVLELPDGSQTPHSLKLALSYADQ